MIDLHSHILPELDDGPPSLDVALEMCDIAYDDGIRTIVATPHIGRFPNNRSTILSKLEYLKSHVKKKT